MRTPLVLFAAAFLSGCVASFGGATYQRSDRVEAELAYYAAMRAMAQPQQPLVEIIAHPGEAITGLDTIRVFAPHQRHELRQYTPYTHPGWQMAGQVAQSVLPILGMGWSSYRLADVVGQHLGNVAQAVTVVEQPAPVIVPRPDTIIVEPQPPLVVMQPPPLVVEPRVVVP
jgi:hypothetical protein